MPVKINWSAVAQAVIIAGILGVFAELKSQHDAMLELKAQMAALQTKVDAATLRSEASDTRLSDEVGDMKVTLGVLEERTAIEAARHGRKLAPAALEGR